MSPAGRISTGSGREGGQTGRSIGAQFAQPVVADTEMVSEFVYHSMLHYFGEVFERARLLFDRALVEGDGVRRDQTVVMGAFGQRNTLIKAEQGVAGFYAGIL